ncbi:MAG: 3-hydroxyacyl-ACP dehydratase [Flavihumibacter sp.]
MLIDQDHITTLIPQRAPFVMIDALEYHADGKTGTRFSIRNDNIFLRGGRLETAALIENLAQTAAASAGYEAVLSGKKVKIGFIGAISKLQVHGEAVAGDLLETEITQLQQVMNVTMVSGSVRCGGKALLSGEMKIFLQPHSS